MANYEMQIIYGGGTFTFPITPEFFPNMEFVWKRDGKTVAVVDSVPVHGWFSDNDQDVIVANWNTLKSIAQNKSPVVFIFRKESGGTIIHQYNRAHIQNLTTVNEGGGFVNHLEFNFNISEERGVTFSQLVDVNREDNTIKEQDADGRIRERFFRTVSATGVFGRLAPARNFVNGLKPTSGTLIRESIREVHFDGTVTGTWEFSEKVVDSSRFRVWNERIKRSPGQRTSRFYPTVDGVITSAVLLRGGKKPTVVRVTGHVEAAEKGDLPRADRLVNFVDSRLGSKITSSVLANPSFDGVYPIEWDRDDPLKPTFFAIDYSYELTFAELGGSRLVRGIDVRHRGNTG